MLIFLYGLPKLPTTVGHRTASTQADVGQNLESRQEDCSRVNGRRSRGPDPALVAGLLILGPQCGMRCLWRGTQNLEFQLRCKRELGV